MLGLRTHIVRTENIKEVSDWYKKIFQKEPYFENEWYIGFDIQGFEFWVFKADVEQTKNHSINMYWWVEDIQDEYERIIQLWAKSLCQPVNVWGNILMADLQDPFGNFFGIIYNPDFRD